MPHLPHLHIQIPHPLLLSGKGFPNRPICPVTFRKNLLLYILLKNALQIQVYLTCNLKCILF